MGGVGRGRLKSNVAKGGDRDERKLHVWAGSVTWADRGRGFAWVGFGNDGAWGGGLSSQVAKRLCSI